MYDSLAAQMVKDSIADDKELEMSAIAHLSAKIQDLMEDFSISWSKAVNWLMDAEETDDPGFFLWANGIHSIEFEQSFSGLLKVGA